MMGTEFQGRHGDILLEAREKLPPGARLVERTSHYVAALGGSTGHAHTVISPTPMGIWEGPDGSRYMLTGEGVMVSHQEHGTMPLPAGIIEIIPQQETDLSGQWRKVRD